MNANETIKYGSHTCDEVKKPIHVGRFDRFEVEAVNAFILVDRILSSMSADTTELKRQIEKLKILTQ